MEEGWHDGADNERAGRFDFKGLERYARRLARRMGLRDWEVHVHPRVPAGGPDEGAVAAVHCAHGQQVAVVMFSDGFFDLSPAEQRATVVHELVHPHFDLEYRVARPRLGRDTPLYELAREYGIDAVSRVIARYMPLPPAPFRPLDTINRT